MSTLRSALKQASHTFPDRKQRLIRFLRSFLPSQDPLKRTRLKPGQTCTIRADLFSIGTLKDTSEARIMLTVTEQERGNAHILIPDRLLSAFAIEALKAIRIARNPIEDAPQPKVEVMHPGIVPDQINVVPQNKDTLAGHTVIQIWIGGVPLDISANTSVWRKVLKSIPQG
jgi:hypothetical protein